MRYLFLLILLPVMCEATLAQRIPYPLSHLAHYDKIFVSSRVPEPIDPLFGPSINGEVLANLAKRELRSRGVSLTNDGVGSDVVRMHIILDHLYHRGSFNTNSDNFTIFVCQARFSIFVADRSEEIVVTIYDNYSFGIAPNYQYILGGCEDAIIHLADLWEEHH